MAERQIALQRAQKRKRKASGRKDKSKGNLTFLIFVLVCTILSLIAAVVVCGVLITTHYGLLLARETGNTSVIFDGLTPQEISSTAAVFKGLKPEYLAAAKTVVITHNLSGQGFFIEGWEGGINLPHERRAVILYEPHVPLMRYTLCHEILHNVLRASELFTYDIGEHLVCFDDGIHNGTQRWYKVRKYYG